MTISLTLRDSKGSALTHTELDNNFTNIKNEFEKVTESIDLPHNSGDPFVDVITYRKRVGDSGGTVITWPTVNKVATDLWSCTITGGGQPTDENMIGYIEDKNTITGNASNVVFTSTFDIASTDDVRVELIRADGVRLGVTFVSGILIEKVGGKAQVTYPTAGHFVNDAAGGAEGSNTALLSTQRLVIRSTVKRVNLGSNCHLSGIHAGYDNVITEGIMSQIVAHAHGRILSGSHNGIGFGSYCTIEAGEYGLVLGGTNIVLNGGTGSGAMAIGGSAKDVRGGTNWSIGGTSININGTQSTNAGGAVLNLTGNGIFGTGRENTVNGNDAGVMGFQNTLTGGWSFGAGFGNTIAIYGAAFGRGNTVAEGGFSIGRQNSTTAIYGQASGYRAVSYNAGESAVGCGLVGDATNGERQTRKLQLTTSTTDAALTYPVDVGGVNAITIPADSCAIVRVMCVALRDNNTESRTFAGDFIVNRAGTADPTVDGVTTDVSVPVSKTLSTSGSNLFIRAISGGLRLRCQGEAGKNVRWLISVELVQVVN